jgi:hypothetical protein
MRGRKRAKHFSVLCSTYIPGPQISKSRYNIYQFLAFFNRPKFPLHGSRTAPTFIDNIRFHSQSDEMDPSSQLIIFVE